MKSAQLLHFYLEQCPLIAILRGLQPQEAPAMGEMLLETGFRIIEVPLNSPAPYDSIAELAQSCGQEALIGAGTVLSREQVDKVAEAGGRLIVAPNTRRSVIKATCAQHMISLPGVFTPTEAHKALDAGAHGLKFFPSEAISSAMLQAMRATLPPSAPLIMVGGITAHNMASYLQAGAYGFGFGSALYQKGQSLAETRQKAKALITAWQALALEAESA